MTRKFDGFPPGKPRVITLPATFVTELLPMIDDLAELKVTLFVFWAVQQREGRFRYLRRSEFTNDISFMSGLALIMPDTQPEVTLDAALERACERGSLVCADVTLENDAERLYFINAEPGRAAVEQIRRGLWKPGDDGKPVEIMPERPNIYQLYEANIGPLTPMIAESLKDAEREYPAAWIEEAIRVAVENNARSWHFIQAVLDRWRKEGKQNEIASEPGERDGRRYISGKYADFIEH
jgi:DnaD/phage-associated family protein